MFQQVNSRQAAPRVRGLTLIELMIVVAIVATLIMLTAPSFKRMLDVQRVRSINAALVTDLQFARSEAASRNQMVFVKFDNTGTTLTCYVILAGSPTSCNCKNTPGVNVCTGSTKEIRTVQVERQLGITVAVPSSQVAKALAFDPATGRLLVVPVDIPEPPTAPFKVEVQHNTVGGFVDALEATGRPTVCSPSGQISGVPPCA